MFDEYAKKFEELGENVPKIFKKVAKKGAIKFVNEAKTKTKQEGLVDTGYYRDNWTAEAIEPQENVYGVMGQNIAEYASHLEWGTGRGIKGRFVGRLSLEETNYYCIQELDKEFEKAFTKYHQKFTEE